MYDSDCAEKIIRLERELGWPQDQIGKEWETEVRKKITTLQVLFRQRILLSAETEICGQGGWDRFDLCADGQIVFIGILCTHISKEKSLQIAEQMGFTVI